MEGINTTSAAPGQTFISDTPFGVTITATARGGMEGSEVPAYLERVAAELMNQARIRRGQLPVPQTGVELIAAERKRQIEEKGYTPENDFSYRTPGTLATAAACYAVYDCPHPVATETRVILVDNNRRGVIAHDAFPFVGSRDTREKHTPIERLIIAGALIAAEIDRTIAECRSAELPRPAAATGEPEGGK